MDSWILKQLRTFVLSELKDHIPEGYFETKVESFQVNETLEGHRYLSFENRWGYLASKLGQKLHFEPPVEITPRQLSASELLMNLGMLASAEASWSVCEQIHQKALEKKCSDGNAGKVAAQLKYDHIPTFQSNIKGALEQFLLHLSKEEAMPYISLVDNPKNVYATASSAEDIIELKPNFMGLGININALYRKFFGKKIIR